MAKKDNNTNAAQENGAEIKQKKRRIKKEKREARRLNVIAERQKKREEHENSLEYKLYLAAKEQLNSKNRWYKLDNDAVLYPMIASTEGRSTFRLSVLLKEKVDPMTLQLAVNDVYMRFPTMTGTLKYGVFWPYIDKPQYPLVVTEQKKLPCQPILIDGKRSQLRVTYFGNEIATEFFHSATDGTGGLIFLNSLLVCYFRRKGHDIADMTNCLDCRDKPRFDEIADNIPKIVKKSREVKTPKQEKANILTGAKLPDNLIISRYGYCSAAQLKETAKKHGATVNQLLCAVELWALKEYCLSSVSKDKRPVTILVPVNLRKIFGMDTLRNFTNYMLFRHNGQEDIDEIIADIKEQEKAQLNKDYFVACVSQNYNSAHNPLLKIVPLAVKRFVIRLVCTQRGGGIINTSTMSNLGAVKAPEEFSDLIIRYDFLLGQENNPPIAFSCATFNDVCSISVSDSFAEPIAETFFFRKLADLGIDLAVESDLVEVP